jgi:SAM-dependent methyltransferase
MILTSHLARLRSRIRRAVGTSFPGSRAYWEQRYAAGGNSGAGSYGRLAEFKARYLNRFVSENGVHTIIEFGCGDGHQLSLANYLSYFGVDVSRQALELCRRKFHNDPSKRFGFTAPLGEQFDAALSLDVIFHLIEDNAFSDYMRSLFSASRNWVIIYSSNCEQAEFESHYGIVPAQHVKHREFTEWTRRNLAEWRLFRRDRNPYCKRPRDRVFRRTTKEATLS